jgi:hypothetical protein
MTALAKFDPWGPISTILYEIGDSDFVENTIGNTGIDVAWRTLTREESYSHSTRIRAMRRDISRAYAELSEQHRGQFAQIVLKPILERHNAELLLPKLIDRLADIGWTVSERGVLETQDALISEQFFPPNSEHDAYIAIRDILAQAAAEIVIVDAYLGASLLQTLKSLTPRSSLVVRFLTSERHLKPDFRLEAATFQKQVPHIKLEVRTTPDFHDRFIEVDGIAVYHVGASIKDAGGRAFMISRLEDPPNLESAQRSISQAWQSGKIVL